MTLKALVPLDGSRLAEESLTYLRSLQRVDALDVCIVSVVDDTEEFGELSGPEAIEREANVLATYLREVAADLERHLGVKVKQELHRGNPQASLLEVVAAESPDLLLITSHGRSGIERWRIGSVADKVIRGAECDTLVIGPNAARQEPWSEAFLAPEFKQILVPLDGSAIAEQALPLARRYAQAFGSTVHLVRAVPVPATIDGMGNGSISGPNIMTSIIDVARSYLDQVTATFEAPGGVKADVPIGGAAGALQEYIEANGIDLTVMTSHGRGGFLRTALGSVADRLLGTHSPVLVVRPHSP